MNKLETRTSKPYNQKSHSINDALVPCTSYFVSTYQRDSWGNPGNTLDAEFDVVYGSADGGLDDAYIDRAVATGSISFPQGEGFVYKIQTGYGIASGQCPLLAGRRVRAASDGTQFAIEVLEVDYGGNTVVIERVYFLTSVLNEPVKVRIYNDETQTGAPASEFDLSELEYCEVAWDSSSSTILMPSKIGSAPYEVLYFAMQMIAVMSDDVFPEYPSFGMSIMASQAPAPGTNGVTFDSRTVEARTLQPIRTSSLLSRFAARYPDRRILTASRSLPMPNLQKLTRTRTPAPATKTSPVSFGKRATLLPGRSRRSK